MNNKFKQYIIFWLSQTFSQLGSSMTSFALILWIYMQNKSAMTVSLMSFFNYIPYIIVSVTAGAFVDYHSKKVIMLVSDSIAAMCSMFILILNIENSLHIWHIYLVNFIIGFMNAFQGPASSVAIGKIIPKERLEQVSGLNSFSSNLVAVLSPILAATLFGFGSLWLVLVIDLCTFVFAFFILLFVLKIPENILSPMILARSNSNIALGVVNTVMGIGGIIGGVIVSTGKLNVNSAKMIYLSAMFSFLFGDITMALGKNVILWSLEGLAASLPIPFITAGSSLILYKYIPEEMQGRIFSIRNAIQFSTIPIGIILGGFLADYVFEPFMTKQNNIVFLLQMLVGKGAGSGMAIMFLLTGISGSIFSLICYRQKYIQKL
ncbi:MAG: MFS transporter [Lachnospiraceae bacterium]|nr:MFS transporter [Lachnospiraceae bacterium]